MANNKKKNTVGANTASTPRPGSEKKSHLSSIYNMRSLNTVSFIVVVASMFILLVSRFQEYMMKVDDLSFFLGTSSMFAKCMDTPGGLLTWLSLYLTQTFGTPWVGTLVYCLLLGLLWLVFVRAFRIPRGWFGISAILPVVVFLSFTSLGYLIFTLKPVGYVFTLPLGLIFALSIFWGYRKLRPWWLRTVVVAVIVVAGYPLLGFYALLCAVLCAADIYMPGDRRGMLLRLVPAAVALFLVVFVPWASFMYVGGEIIFSQIYISPLPRFYKDETAYKLFYWFIFGLCLVCAALSARFGSVRSSESTTFRKAACLVPVPVLLLFVFGGIDANLRLTLKMDRAIWNQDYNKAINLAENFDGTPTRLNSVLTYIALLRTGQAGDRMFALPYGWEPYATTRAARAMHDAGAALISYHLGLINYSYRWSTENLIGQGLSAERLKLMAKCALLNREPELAKTYIDLLYNNPKHRAWATKYRRFLSDPMQAASDPEMASIRMLMCNQNEFINDKGQFEGYVWPLLASGMPGTMDYDELCMQASLMTRDLDTFMARLERYRMTHPRLPRHYQEAALLWSMLGKHKCPVQIDPAIEANHNAFLETFRITSQGEAEGQRDAMHDRFGDTYWFYYVLCDNMPLL